MTKFFISVLFMGICSQAFASTLLLDFGDSASAPTLGGTWNADVEATVAVGGLNYADGTVATGIGLEINNHKNSVTDQGVWGADKAWVDADATADYIWRDESAFSITLTGLDDALTYDISMVAARNGGTNRVGTYTVQGLTTTDDVSSAGINIATSFSNRTLLNWSAVSPISGEIVLTATPDSGQTVFVNAMQIVTIPEPGTLMLVGIAGGVLILSRLRRK
ncbi:PEP-CTERM sorting domain-containing protein [Kiritimatiellota bacterium B12222]|nr:PEP-CTERM sorting domain-containing protein [Kiritimatiellota bacterium B12222]